MVLFTSSHLIKDATQETLFQLDDNWITNEDTKPYIPKYVDNIKLSRSQYIATFIINFCPYVDNMVALETSSTPSADSLSDILIENPCRNKQRHCYAQI